MPEVIDLLSSTPPPPIDLPRLSSITAPRSSPPPFAAPQSFLSDEYDSVFNYDDFDKPTKRRRLSDDDPSPPRDIDPQPTTNPLFLFSDDSLILPAEGGPSDLKKTSTRHVGDSDPIVFTSSAPGPAGQASHLREATYPRTNTITIDDDEDCQIDDNHAVRTDDIEDFSDQLLMPDINELISLAGRTTTSASAAHPLFSNRTASLLAGLENRSKPSSRSNGSGGGMEAKTTGRSRKGKENECKEIEVLSDEVVEPRKPGRKTSKVSTVDKEAKAREREAAKAQREHERQLEKERKLKLKEEKAREKQIAADLAEVNKLKVDKKESIPEMIIDLASSFEGTSVGNQSVGYITRLGAEHTFFTSSIPNIIKWRRKVKAKFNETAGYWEPCPPHIQEENHVMCLLTAQEFVDMVVGQPDTAATGTNKLPHHVRRIQTAYPNCKPIYLIEGLTAWMRKNQNSRNRAYQAEVRRQLDQTQDPSSTRPSRKKATDKPETTAPVDDNTIEAALLDLQVTHSCLIHHTNSGPDSVEWIKNFTEHISTVPYRRERMDGNDSAFCMDSGQVGIGEDKSDTFVKMLQEINRVTASMAYGIVGRYPTVVDLVHGMRRHGPAMLEDVKKSANKNGALTDSRIGPAASKRLYRVFMGLDPSSTDI